MTELIPVPMEVDAKFCNTGFKPMFWLFYLEHQVLIGNSRANGIAMGDMRGMTLASRRGKPAPGSLQRGCVWCWWLQLHMVPCNPDKHKSQQVSGEEEKRKSNGRMCQNNGILWQVFIIL